MRICNWYQIYDKGEDYRTGRDSAVAMVDAACSPVNISVKPIATGAFAGCKIGLDELFIQADEDDLIDMTMELTNSRIKRAIHDYKADLKLGL